MSETTVAIVGTGPHPDRDASSDGSSMGYRQARGYEALEGCSIVACADIVRENAEAFAEEFDLAADRVFDDHGELLAAVEPDLVSVCTPPATHPTIVGDCAASGRVRGLHCEKPMAVTWEESRKMVETCEDRGVQLTFNLQSRCSDAAARAKQLIEDG